MEKKIYITPSLTTVFVQTKESMLNTSDVNAAPTGYGDGSDAATKDEGDYDLWDE